jgi:hypothetical protein
VTTASWARARRARGSHRSIAATLPYLVLEDYARALEDAGLLLEMVREPSVSEAAVSQHPSWRRWRRLPMFLQLRAVKREGHLRRGGHGRTTSS